MSKKPLGIIVYKGPSQLDGKQIIAVATGIGGRKKNEKTGDAISIWIIRPDVNPYLATKIGDDYSYCGDCKHRHFGSCYIIPHHGAVPVFHAYHRDRYEHLDIDNIVHFQDQHVRLGAYGDPAAVPIAVWDKIAGIAKSVLGYTHQWKNPKFSEYKKYCMASVDYDKEYHQAQKLRWRTFRIRMDDEGLFDGEFVCPASKENGKKSNCSSCQACGGWNSRVSKNPCIIVHGGGAEAYKVRKFIIGMNKLKGKKKWKVDFEARKEALCKCP
jgi:hypothetical protein